MDVYTVIYLKVARFTEFTVFFYEWHQIRAESKKFKHMQPGIGVLIMKQRLLMNHPVLKLKVVARGGSSGSSGPLLTFFPSNGPVINLLNY